MTHLTFILVSQTGIKHFPEIVVGNRRAGSDVERSRKRR